MFTDEIVCHQIVIRIDAITVDELAWINLRQMLQDSHDELDLSILQPPNSDLYDDYVRACNDVKKLRLKSRFNRCSSYVVMMVEPLRLLKSQA